MNKQTRRNLQEQRRLEIRVEILAWIFSVVAIVVIICGVLKLTEIVKTEF